MILEFEDQEIQKHPKCSRCMAKFASTQNGLCYDCKNILKSEKLLIPYLVITNWICNNWYRTKCKNTRSRQNKLCYNCQQLE
jgi:hypothetical protein